MEKMTSNMFMKAINDGRTDFCGVEFIEDVFFNPPPRLKTTELVFTQAKAKRFAIQRTDVTGPLVMVGFKANELHLSYNTVKKGGLNLEDAEVDNLILCNLNIEGDLILRGVSIGEYILVDKVMVAGDAPQTGLTFEGKEIALETRRSIST